MHLFLMKAFWEPETSSFSLGASLSASSLVMILARLLIRLIGQKSDRLVASSFLGNSTMLASLMRSKRHLLREWKAWSAATRSASMMG